LLLRECRFLRIEDYILQEARKTPGRAAAAAAARAGQRQIGKIEAGTKMFLRVFVQGLPTLKRSRWHMPLCWVVSKVLQKVNCYASLRCRELYVAMDDSNEEFVRIDFTAVPNPNNEGTQRLQSRTPTGDAAAETLVALDMINRVMGTSTYGQKQDEDVFYSQDEGEGDPSCGADKDDDDDSQWMVDSYMGVGWRV